jgi:hypothetical protein
MEIKNEAPVYSRGFVVAVSKEDYNFYMQGELL